MAYPFGELSVHHEVVNMLLCFGEFELSGNHSYHKGSAACTLPEDVRGSQERKHTVRRLKKKKQDLVCPKFNVSISREWNKTWSL